MSGAWISDLGDGPDYTLNRPVAISVYQDGEHSFVIGAAALGVHVSGDSYEEAVDELKAYIVDAYESLERMVARGATMGPVMARQLEAMRRVIVRRPSDFEDPAAALPAPPEPTNKKERA